MCSALVKFILLTEVHEEFSWGFKWKFQVDEVVYELTHSVEDYILRQNFRNLHRLWLRFTISLRTSSSSRLWSLSLTLWSLTIIPVSRTSSTRCSFHWAIWFASATSSWYFFTRCTEKARFHFAAYRAEAHRRKQASCSISKAHRWCVLCLLLCLLLILLSFFLRLDSVMELEIDESLQA